MSGAEDIDRRCWFALCSREDLPATHIFETDLLGQELAVWRGPGGIVNVWVNRCPHRGIRLTVGAIMGAELRCAYHGYRYTNGSGACSAVPAQPGRAAPRSLCVKSYPVLEAGGLIWTRLADPEPAAGPPLDGTGDFTPLYGLAVKSRPAEVAIHLAGYRFRPSAALAAPETADESCSTVQIDAYGFQSVARKGRLTSEVYLFLQPVDAQTTNIHGVLCEVPDGQRLEAALRHHAQLFGRLRDACERGVRDRAP